MKTLTLRNRFQANSTIVENDFIDNYMAQANGEYVKVYLLLLRHLNSPDTSLTVSKLADILECTEKDIVRALNHWAKKGLLKIEYDETGNVCGLSLGKNASSAKSEMSAFEQLEPISDTPVTLAQFTDISQEPMPETEQQMQASQNATSSPFANVSQEATRAREQQMLTSQEATRAREQQMQASQEAARAREQQMQASQEAARAREQQMQASQSEVSEKKEKEQLRQLYFVAEQYLAKPLSVAEIQKINYYFDTLGFSIDLIEYLIEYCVENGHNNMKYIDSVAFAWSDANIKNVTEAKTASQTHNKNCFAVLNAFGIKGRGPAPFELTFIKKWVNEYRMTLDVIVEACNRTIANTHKPDFRYADRILNAWFQKGVHCFSDIERADLAFRQEKEAKKNTTSNVSKPASSAPNRFNNFEGRSYDMDSLEQQLLKSMN